jgi:hypothetical protein
MAVAVADDIWGQALARTATLAAQVAARGALRRVAQVTSPVPVEQRHTETLAATGPAGLAREAAAAVARVP